MRDTQLDIYRALAMVYIVCVIHILYWLDCPCEWLRSMLLFEMPVIFFIAGAALSVKDKAGRTANDAVHEMEVMLVNRCRRILIPLYVFLPVLFLWMAVMTPSFAHQPDYPIDIHALTGRDILMILLTMGCDHIPTYGYTWFIACYLTITCIFPLERRIFHRIPAVSILAANILLVFLLSQMTFAPCALDRFVKNVVVYHCFYLIGFLFYKKCRPGLLYTVTLLSVSITLWQFCTGQALPMQNHKFPADGLFLIFGIAWICVLSLILKHVNLPNLYLFRLWNTRGYNIYLYQIFSFYIVYLLYDHWIKHIHLSTSSGLAAQLFPFMVCSLLSFLINTISSYLTYGYECIIVRGLRKAGKSIASHHISK